nr:trypsin-like serine protease [Candidatus Neomarinimicrobiota bacterium]
MKIRRFVITVGIVGSQLIWSQSSPLQYHYNALNVTTSTYNSVPSRTENFSMVYSTDIGEQDAPYLRLFFGESELGDSSYVKVRNLSDNTEQVFDSVKLSASRNSTLYFNTASLRFELYHNKFDDGVYATLDTLLVGELNEETLLGGGGICDEVDDRTRYNDPRIGRITGIGCSAWIVENDILITAGHCIDGHIEQFENDIIEFNVPSSLEDGTPQHSILSDQYYTTDFYIFEHLGQYGNDWAVFMVQDNYSTGLQPIESQNDYFELEQENSFEDNEDLIKTGYGIDGPSPDFGYNAERNEDNKTCQTITGPSIDYMFDLEQKPDAFYYSVDQMHGDSGCPLIRSSSGSAVGICNGSGCDDDESLCVGTSLTNIRLWEAIYGSHIQIVNRHLDDYSSNLGGTLSLVNNDTEGFDYIEENSGNWVSIIVGDNYTAMTNQPNISDERHLKWDDPQDYLLEVEIPSISEQETSAWFDVQEEVTIESSQPVEILIYDPWYAYEDPITDEWIQPNTYVPISEVAEWDEQNQEYVSDVFLDQNPQFYPTLPMYNLCAPAFYASDSEIFEFDHWGGTDVNYGTQNTTNLCVNIVFEDPDAGVIAYYDAISFNSILTLNEDLTIPAGAEYQFGSSCRIDIEDGAILTFAGTVNEPINLEPEDSNGWNGIRLLDSSNINMQYTKVIAADIALDIQSSASDLNGIVNNTFGFCGTGIKIQHDDFSDLEIKNNVFFK